MLGFQPISAMPISDVVYTELEITRDSGMKTWTLAKSETSWKLPPKRILMESLQPLGQEPNLKALGPFKFWCMYKRILLF